MSSCVESFILQGIDAVPCEIEAHLSTRGLPSTTIVGLPDTAVRESIQRVRTAILTCGFDFPATRLTLNLAPADLRKEGPVYDLPIALAILLANGTLQGPVHGPSAPSAPSDPRDPGDPGEAADRADRVDLADLMVAGELALDGRVRFVRGATSLAMLARQRGRRGVLVPADNAGEAAAVDGIEVYGVRTLAEAIAHLNGVERLEPRPPLDAERMLQDAAPAIDFADVRGQEAAKRALVVAAAGRHNVVMLGPAGTGKTMMAKALPGILPPLTRAEALEVTRVYSSVGRLPRDGPGDRTGGAVSHGALVAVRPVRMPHHTASAAAIIGGGSIPRAGEVSLAHHGVLFLDEMPEFTRAVLETLRQPLEDRVVTVARAHGTFRFPADFMLVGALNPTRGGAMPDGVEGFRDMQQYLARLSGPLIDRIDIHVEVPAVAYAQLTGGRAGTSTAELRELVLAARARQAQRQGDVPNGRLAGRELTRVMGMDDGAHAILRDAMTELSLSARAYDKVRRVARTIADVDGSPETSAHHVAEAVQYRLLDALLGAVNP